MGAVGGGERWGVGKAGGEHGLGELSGRSTVSAGSGLAVLTGRSSGMGMQAFARSRGGRIDWGEEDETEGEGGEEGVWASALAGWAEGGGVLTSGGVQIDPLLADALAAARMEAEAEGMRF